MRSALLSFALNIIVPLYGHIPMWLPLPVFHRDIETVITEY